MTPATRIYELEEGTWHAGNYGDDLLPYYTEAGAWSRIFNMFSAIRAQTRSVQEVLENAPAQPAMLDTKPAR